ncbi:hypothetical protein VVT58_06730 [Sphingobium sp. SJ10-10]|uniref:hypothetical protein n=1 Tax=Sphingobium sp. SJ10-10 TaxID=3114999 RepID=UPI002E181CF4|nr:hypothetical protein [Sphingobium sp. SJ10-10]
MITPALVQWFGTAGLDRTAENNAFLPFFGEANPSRRGHHFSMGFVPLFADASRLDAGSFLKRKAARIAATHAKQLDRAATASKMVQQDIRYIYVGLNAVT